MFFFAPGTGEENRYTYEFTEQQLEMAKAIALAIEEGGDQAIAASRGEGKSTLAWRLLLKYVLQGKLRFPVLFAATGTAAGNTLEEIKLELENNPRLRAYYPEIVEPILALEGVPQRAGTMLATGRRHDNGEAFEEVLIRFSWCGQQIYLPDVPGAPGRGAIIATRGLDAEVRGLRIKGRRVDLALIDDPDTEETSRSEEQADKLEKRIERAIAGLGGQRRTVARIMLTTIQTTISASYKFTDPTQKPSWRGKRYRFLIQPPTHLDEWQAFITLWQQDQLNGTNKAGELYAANRRRMDEGAIVSNKHRYTDKQLSALEHYYTLVARYGPEAVASEYDNDPPKPAMQTDVGITARRIQTQLSGYRRKLIPPACTILTQGIDCKKQSLHWIVRAWEPNGTGFTIDKGIFSVRGTSYGVEEGVEQAIRAAIIEHMEEFRDRITNGEYIKPDGEIITDPLTLCDSRYQTDAVRLACIEIGAGIMPVMGFGRSKGVSGTFRAGRPATATFKPGDHYNRVIVEVGQQKLWGIEADTDHWKRWEHERWMTGPDKPGRMTIYGERDESTSRHGGLSQIERDHLPYAQHIVNEKEIDEPYKGGFRKIWHVKSDNVHWLDASYYSDVAAIVRGVALLKPVELAKPPVKRKTRFYSLNV